MSEPVFSQGSSFAGIMVISAGAGALLGLTMFFPWLRRPAPPGGGLELGDAQPDEEPPALSGPRLEDAVREQRERGAGAGQVTRARHRGHMRRASGCLIVLALAAGCEAPGARRTARAGAADSSVQIMIGATTTLTTNGSRKGHVTADSAFVYQRALRIDFRRMRVTLFAPQGEQIASLSAPRGLYAIEGGTLDASGGVVVVTAAGDSLTTPSLTYDKTKLQFRTDSAYVYKSRTGVRTGSGFTSDLELRNLRSGRGGT